MWQHRHTPPAPAPWTGGRTCPHRARAACWVGLTPCAGIQAGLKGQHIPGVWGSKQVTAKVPWGCPSKGPQGEGAYSLRRGPQLPNQTGFLAFDTQGCVGWGLHVSARVEQRSKIKRYGQPRALYRMTEKPQSWPPPPSLLYGETRSLSLLHLLPSELGNLPAQP